MPSNAPWLSAGATYASDSTVDSSHLAAVQSSFSQFFIDLLRHFLIAASQQFVLKTPCSLQMQCNDNTIETTHLLLCY
jgi:hypothetical protein